MNRNDKIKLAIGAGGLLMAVILIVWQLLPARTGTTLDSELKGPQVEAPTDPKTGKPVEVFGNRRTPSGR